MSQNPARVWALVEELDAYIEFLNTANEGPITMAHLHGWRCPEADVARGKEFRKRIGLLRDRAHSSETT